MLRPARDSSLMKPPSVEGFPIQLSRRGFELGGILRIDTIQDGSRGASAAPRRQIALFGRDHELPTLFGDECAAAGGVCARGRFLLIDM